LASTTEASFIAEQQKLYVSVVEGGECDAINLKRLHMLVETWEPLLEIQARCIVREGYVGRGIRGSPALRALSATLRPFYFSLSEGPSKEMTERKHAIAKLGALSERLQRAV